MIYKAPTSIKNQGAKMFCIFLFFHIFNSSKHWKCRLMDTKDSWETKK